MFGPVPIAAIVVLLSTLLFGFSWILHVRRNDRYALVAIMAGGALLRIILAVTPHLHSWDERYHALVAKNMLLDPFEPRLYADAELPYNTEDWTKSHIWLHKPPLPLWSIALSLYLFGMNVLSVRIPSMILSVIAIALCHGIALKLFDRRIAWLTALFAAMHGLIIQLTGGDAATDHIDVFLFFFTTLSIWFALRWRDRPSLTLAVLAGASIGAAVLSKWMVGLLPLLLVPIIWYGRHQFKTWGPAYLVMTATCIMTFLPWEIYIGYRFPDELRVARDQMLGHFDRGLDGHAEPWYYHIHKLGMLYGEFIYIPLMWSMWQAWRSMKGHYIMLFIWILIPYVIFSCATTKMQAYTIVSAPALYMVLANYVDHLSRMRLPSWSKFALGILLIAMPFRQMLERIKPWQDQLSEPEWMERIMAQRFNSNQKIVIFNEPHSIELMFHHDVVAYDHIPTTDLVQQLEGSGYSVHVLP